MEFEYNANKILDKFRDVMHIHTDKELAGYFEVSTTALSEWRKRNSTQAIVRLIELSSKHGISLNYLLFDIEPIHLKDCTDQMQQPYYPWFNPMMHYKPSIFSLPLPIESEVKAFDEMAEIRERLKKLEESLFAKKNEPL